MGGDSLKYLYQYRKKGKGPMVVNPYGYASAACGGSTTSITWSNLSAISGSSASDSCDWPDYLTMQEVAHYDECESKHVLTKVVKRDFLNPGESIELPDGSKVIVDNKGNFKIEDKDAVVTYKANNKREFSPHLNASDMLAQFIQYVSTLGVKQNEVMGLPIELFINWLIIEAATRDEDQIPEDVVPVPQHRRIQEIIKPRCGYCQRYIPRLHYQKGFPYCSPVHAQKRLVSLQP